MAKSKNVVQINGKTYDAISGHPTASAKPKTPKKKKMGMVVDGFIRNKKAPTKTSKQASQLQAPQHPAQKRGSIHANEVHKVTKKSVTLSRGTLQKPSPAPKAHAKSTPAELSSSQQPSSHRTGLGLSQSRITRAKTVQKNAGISKFGTPQAQQLHRTTKQQSTPAQQPTQKSAKEDLISQAMASLSTSNAHQPKTVAKKTNLITDIARRASNSSSLLSKTAAGMVVLVALGYGVYANVPNIALRVAASRAGFEANMPGYSPAGFSFAGPIAYSPGQITIEYASTSDGRAFTVTERETNWDSQSLLDNHVAQNNALYQTFQERGLTIYVYEGNKAAWVNGGIWYTIEGDALLNTEQLIKIASSL